MEDFEHLFTAEVKGIYFIRPLMQKIMSGIDLETLVVKANGLCNRYHHESEVSHVPYITFVKQSDRLIRMVMEDRNIKPNDKVLIGTIDLIVYDPVEKYSFPSLKVADFTTLVPDQSLTEEQV